MIQHLRLYKQTPDNGLAAFAGNVAEREGQSDLKVWGIEPPLPLKIRIYRCDKQFVIEPLNDMIQDKEVYGMVVLDRRDANIAMLKGKTIIPLQKTHSEVPGKHKTGGQCLLKDSLIQLSDGSLPNIEIVHNPNKVKSVMINKKISIQNSDITDKWNVKKNKVFKIVTKNPRLEVHSSKDHVFFVSTSEGIVERAAEELKEGDYLIMPEKIDIKGRIQKINSKKYYNSFSISKDGQKILKEKRLEKKLLQKDVAKKIGVAQITISRCEIGKINPEKDTLERLCRALNINFKEFLKEYTIPKHHRNSEVKLPTEITPEFTQFIGYLIGDGCIETDRITFFEQEKRLAMEYKKKYDGIFNLNSSYNFRKSKNYHQIRYTSRPLVRLIKEEFPEIKTALNTEIPKKILQSGNNVISGFLRGIFDAEGYSSTRLQVGLGMNNKRFIQQIQMLLLRFGIISSIHKYDNRANKYSKNPRFTIDITEKKSLQLFQKFIGFSSVRKSKKVENVIKSKSDKSNVRQILMPGKKIRKIIESAGFNLELFPKVNSFFRNGRMMGKEAFKSSILANIKDKRLYDQLEEIYNVPVLPVKIKEIRKMNENAEMIDISVKNQNFIANGILVHNSAQRFERLRDGATKDHLKKVAEYLKDQFLENKELKGILVGGPRPIKYDWVEKGYIIDQLKKKIIAIKDIGYTGEFGLQELLEKCEDVLADEEVTKEKLLMQKFFEILSTKPGKVSYGPAEVKKHLEAGAVEILLISEIIEDDIIEEFEEIAKTQGTEVKIISTETREGVQLKDMGKIAAILRYDTSN